MRGDSGTSRMHHMIGTAAVTIPYRYLLPSRWYAELALSDCHVPVGYVRMKSVNGVVPLQYFSVLVELTY